MTKRATITLDPKNLAFLNEVAARNRSAFINKLIDKERKFAADILRANLEEAADEELQAELKLWEVTLMDGLEDEDDEAGEKPGL